MKYAVSYYTRSGNTKKMADVVGEVLGVTPKDISEGLSEKVETLFLGNSPYAFDMDPNVKEFILTNKDMIGQIVCFGSCASNKSAAKYVHKLCQENGIKFYHKSFKCYGSFLMMHKGHPNEKDLEELRTFVKTVAKELRFDLGAE